MRVLLSSSMLASLCAAWQPAIAQYYPGISALSASGFNGVYEQVETKGYQGLYKSTADSGVSSYDLKPYSAEASGYALFKDGALRVSGASAVKGAESASVIAGVLLTDEIAVKTKGESGPLTVNYSFAVERKVSGVYSMPGGDSTSLAALFSATHGFGDDNGLALTTESRWDASSNSLSDFSVVNYSTPGVAVGVFKLSNRILDGQWTNLSFNLSDSAFVNTRVASELDDALNANVASVSFVSSLFWGGISSVTRLDGSAVEYTVTSRSGLDYSRSYVPSAVPEPSTYALLGAGIALLACRGRKNRKNR